MEWDEKESHHPIGKLFLKTTIEMTYSMGRRVWDEKSVVEGTRVPKPTVCISSRIWIPEVREED